MAPDTALDEQLGMALAGAVAALGVVLALLGVVLAVVARRGREGMGVILVWSWAWA